MKVFLSSVMSGFEQYREAAARGIRALGYSVIRAEDFPASSKAPQIACLDGVRDSDLVVLVMGERYGFVTPSGHSATHEEYLEAKRTKPILVFVQEGVQMEPAQESFRREVESWTGGNFRKAFRSPDELAQHVTHGVHQHFASASAGKVDENELLERAAALVPRASLTNSASAVLAIAGGPKQLIVRPKVLEDREFARGVREKARFGANAVFDEEGQSESRLEHGALSISQRDRAIRLDELGSMVIALPLRGVGSSLWFIEEDLIDQTERALRFSSDLLTQVDPHERLKHVAVVGALLEAGNMGWRTREEHQRSPNAGTLGMADKRILAPLRPPVRTREQLRLDSRSIAEDLVALLRREHSPGRR